MNYTTEIKQEIILLAKEGYSGRQIANMLGLSKSGVNNVLAKRYGRKPKILFFDVETAPSIAATFERYNVNLTPSHILEEGGWIISASWSWLEQTTISSICVTPEEALSRDDNRVVEALVEAINEADIIVAHNGDRFDIPVVKTRALVNQIRTLKSIKSIDTLKIAKKLRFNSNKLDALGHYLGAGRKVATTGISLWIKCLEGNREALKTMVTYNKQDVQLLKDVYTEIISYDPSGINLGLYYDDGHEHCPTCGSTELSLTGRTIKSGLSVFEELQCDDCGRVSRRRTPINSKTHRKTILAKA